MKRSGIRKRFIEDIPHGKPDRDSAGSAPNDSEEGASLFCRG
ncbi:MAG: hypothetical protein RRA35_14425 [Desulfomonilia bacterium]|nr:hypothetical protein [Desulfomonilia bacterium]